MRNPLPFLLVLGISLAGCSLIGAQNKDSSQQKARASQEEREREAQKKWEKLVEILDHYDEVAKVVSNFETRAFMPDGTIQSERGRHEYSKGHSIWKYLDDKGRVYKEIECLEDRIVVRMYKYSRRRHRKPKVKEQEFPVRYGCALQALVHYTGAIKKNRLEKDGKVIMVHDFDPEAGRINKITLMKNNITTEIVFKDIEFVPERTNPAPVADEDASSTNDGTDGGDGVDTKQ